MSDVRYQVFVSSTYTDLIEERQAAISALLQLGAMPAGMELFPVADEEAWTLIKRVIDESDYYLLIIGGRYGSVTDEGISFTEKEYDYAQSVNKPTMAFVHGSPEDIAVGKSDIDKDLRQKLLDFTEKVKKAKHVKLWTSADDLAGKIALSFSSFTKSYPAIGWIRADSGDSTETLRALAAAQQKVSELEGSLDQKGSTPPPGAGGLAADNELLEMTFRVRYEILNLNRTVSKVDPQQQVDVTVAPSWNAIFSEIGAAMLNEATQVDLARRFVSAVVSLCGNEMEEQFIDWLLPQMKAEEFVGGGRGKKKPQPKLRRVSGAPVDGDFEIALLQLDALGLIEQSEKKRTPSDRNTYWTLTGWGRKRLTQLRAVPAGATRPPGQLGDTNDEEAPPSS